MKVSLKLNPSRFAFILTLAKPVMLLMLVAVLVLKVACRSRLDPVTLYDALLLFSGE